MCASKSPRLPLKTLTTPAGRSLVARISEKARAGSGYLSDAITTAAFPLKITAEVSATSGNSAGSSGASTTATPDGSGVVKLKCDDATGLTLPKTCEYLSAQPAKWTSRAIASVTSRRALAEDEPVER